MEKVNKILLFLSMPIVGLLLFLPKAEGYNDKTTHPGLTDEMVDFYNLSFGSNITDEEKEWIVQGAIDEDIPPRWINHFYDPINNEGWKSENLGYIPSSVLKLFSKLFLNANTEIVSSIEWIHNEILQTKYASYGGNNTWENAIRQYANGNKQEAYYILGHVLHLLEDKTVPDHTRNDTHAHEGSVLSRDGGSPYEDYSSQFDRSNLDLAQKLKQENAQPVLLSSIDYYLFNLANYSNNYFFSEHTIGLSKYQNPKIIREDGVYGYGGDRNNDEFPLFEIREKTTNNFAIIKTYSLKNNLVLSSYFSRLSREAVLNGAGAIKLFLDEAEKAKQDKNLITAEPKISWWNKTISPLYSGLAALKSIGNKTQQIASAIQKMPVAPPYIKTTVVPQVNIDQQVAKVVPIAKDMILPKSAQGAVGEIASSSPVVNNNAQLQPAVDAPIAAEQPIAKNTPTSTPKDTISPLPQSSIVAPKSSFIPIYSNPYLELDTKILEAPGAISSSTSADFIFYSAQTSDFEYNLNNAGWQQSQEKLALTDLAQGENTIEVRAVKGAADPTPAIFRWQIDSIAPEINFGIRPDDHTNSTSSIFKFSSNEIVSYECDINNAGWKACEGDLNIADLKEGEQILVIKASDGFGNSASSTSGWLVDLSAPTSILSLDAKYYEPDFSVNWSGNDSGSTTQSGVESFNIDYRLENGEWQEWLRNSTSTSAVFAGNYGNIIYFRSQAKDRAGNLSSWSEEKRTEIINPIANHVVISQIQISGNSANDEFIELYNPTDNSISLVGYKLKRKTASGQEYNLVSDFDSATIAAKSYYLIAHPTGYIGSTTADIFYSSAGYSIASDNTVILYNGTSTIDKIGFGAAVDYEDNVFPANPGNNQSVIRKASATSTITSSLDNSSYDTDINSNDFLLNASSTPRNSNYVKEKNRIKIDNITSAQNDWEMSFAWNHEIKNPDSMLLVLVHTDNNIDSVSYGGEGMILVAENMRHAPFNNLGSYIYALVNPPQGMGNIVVNAAAQASMNATAISLSNYDVLGPFAHIYSERSENKNILHSAGTTTNGIIIDSVTYNNFENDLVANAGQTVFYNTIRTGWTNNLLIGDSYKYIDVPNGTTGWNIGRDAAYVYNVVIVKGK